MMMKKKLSDLHLSLSWSVLEKEVKTPRRRQSWLEQEGCSLSAEM